MVGPGNSERRGNNVFHSGIRSSLWKGGPASRPLCFPSIPTWLHLKGKIQRIKRIARPAPTHTRTHRAAQAGCAFESHITYLAGIHVQYKGRGGRSSGFLGAFVLFLRSIARRSPEPRLHLQPSTHRAEPATVKQSNPTTLLGSPCGTLSHRSHGGNSERFSWE